MSKYDPLWTWIKENKTDNFSLSYSEIEIISGVQVDHSFLNFKKELDEFGWKVGKTSMKDKTIKFEKI